MRTLVLSDTHLGNGQGYDIFAGEDVLPGVIDGFAGPDTRIVLNGDTVDFLMNEDPLELAVDRAVRQARALTAFGPTAAVLQALGRALARGGEVVIRLGNHDVELALPEVQEVFRSALAQPADVAARLVFQAGNAPYLLDVGGARILLTHGDQADAWNKVDYDHLLDAETYGDFRYSAGSRLVKTILNPAKRRFGMRFVDLLAPDFAGAALTALAVRPAAVKSVFQASSLSLLWELFRRGRSAPTFGPEDDGAGFSLKALIDASGLTPDEREALVGALGSSAPPSFGEDGELESASAKLLRHGLGLYAAGQRWIAGETGEQFFRLEPSEGEWAEARRLVGLHPADAIVFGHTHAARFGRVDGLTVVNTGTWVSLMSLPAPDAPIEAWTGFLQRIRENPGLDPALPGIPLFSRLTAAILEPDPTGGARVTLLHYQAGKPPEVMAEGRVLGAP
jgi:predicted phosphodiesterase